MVLLSPYLQGVNGDGAAAPAVEVTQGVHGAGTAKHHQLVEQLLLRHGEQHLGQAGCWNTQRSG